MATLTPIADKSAELDALAKAPAPKQREAVKPAREQFLKWLDETRPDLRVVQ